MAHAPPGAKVGGGSGIIGLWIFMIPVLFYLNDSIFMIHLSLFSSSFENNFTVCSIPNHSQVDR